MHFAARAVVHILLLGTTRLAAAAGDACAETCFGASCDQWDGGAWVTCDVIDIYETTISAPLCE